MNRICLLLAALLFFLTGCAAEDAPPSGTGASQMAGESSDGGTEPSGQEGDVAPVSEAEDPIPGDNTEALNSAAALIPGGDLMAEEDALFLIKSYGNEMRWMEANQLEALERGTPYSEEGAYYLAIPKYNGSRILVRRGEAEPETLFALEETPDQFGLVLTWDGQGDSSSLEVTVEYGGQSASYRFPFSGETDVVAVGAD